MRVEGFLFSVTLGLLFLFEAVASDPILVPNAGSPDGRFQIRLAWDKAQGATEAIDAGPEVQIVTGEGRILAEFPHPANPKTAHLSSREHVRAYWNQDSSAVALSFSELSLNTHLLVYALKVTEGKLDTFISVDLPVTSAIIESMIPRFASFRLRWHYRDQGWHHYFQGWHDASTIQFSAGKGALIGPLDVEDARFMAMYSFTVNISDPNAPVVQRVERIGGE